MSTILITLTPPGQSAVNITSDVVLTRSRFQTSMNAVPGSFELVVRDTDHNASFTTGSEVAVTIDGTKMFGGYLTQISRGSFFSADDTTSPSTYENREWTLHGTDYNILFDRRVWRDTSDYLTSIKLSSQYDGAQLIEAVSNYADMSGFSTSGISSAADTKKAQTLQQGSTLRKDFEIFSYFGGCIWYIDADKTIIYKPYEDFEKRWGFSDAPNYAAITASPVSFQDATYGFREVEATEDGSFMVNDALIWGGSKWAGADGGTVFARVQDEVDNSNETSMIYLEYGNVVPGSSIDTYGRWQTAETRFGEKKFSIKDQVKARANVIVHGPPGTDVYGQQKGLRYPQWQFTFTWFSHDVPLLSGTRDHLKAGDMATIELNTFGVTKLLPMRSLDITFPGGLESDDTQVVEFRGVFGLQLSDPFTLWRYILKNQSDQPVQSQTVVTSTSTETEYGAFYSGAPLESPNGSRTTFSIPFGYIPGTTQVYVDGLLKTPGSDYTESNNIAGEITFSSAPGGSAEIWIICSTLDS